VSYALDVAPDRAVTEMAVPSRHLLNDLIGSHREKANAALDTSSFS